MSNTKLERIAAIASYDSPVEVAAREVLDVCRECCGVNYDVDLEQTVREDERQVFDWLERAGADYSAENNLNVQSWVFGIHTISTDDKSELVLEVSGREWGDWETAPPIENWCWAPREDALKLESVNMLYAINEAASGLDWHAQNCAEYVLCLGVAAILVRSAIRRRPRNWPRGINAYICWAGGDYILLPPHA